MQKHLMLPPFIGKLNRVLETVALPIVGVILIAFAPYITSYAAYLVGGASLLTGLLMLGHAVYHREYASRDTHNTALAIILILCSAVVLLRHKDCLTLLGTIWGVYGVWTGVEDPTEVLYRLSHRQKCLFLSVDTLITLALSVLILYNPAGSFEMHLRLLGIELILVSSQPNHFKT